MLDFLKISTRNPKKDVTEIYPKFLLTRNSDLMIRGGDFYAVWVEERSMWSTDETDVIRMVDDELRKEYERLKSQGETGLQVAYMYDSDSGSIDRWHKYCQKQLRDSFNTLDESLIFSNVAVSKKDYATKRLSYPLEQGDFSAWGKLVSTLYSPEERHKIEWAIGAIVTGDSKTIQKFIVFYGAPGSGKSTIINVMQKLFDGYYTVFDAKALGSSSNSFALEAFKSNPLIAIQHDGDLSRIEDNTRINSIVSHEWMTINEKFKSAYSNQFKTFLIMGTNKPVKITDGKSGLIRRLIDIHPSGDKLPVSEYRQMLSRIDFELGAIAYHCKEVYLSDPSYYDDYIPTEMMGASNDFYNFIIDSYSVFKREDGTTLRAAWEMYKTYCDEAQVSYSASKRVFKEELKNYFREYSDDFNLEDGSRVKSYYKGFRTDKFEIQKKPEVKNGENKASWIELKEQESIFDRECSECVAQYANEEERPFRKWCNVDTKLRDIDTSRIHYIKVPENHIVIDFDIKDDGNKSPEKNLEAASKWPATYAELSKGGAGIHLHYIYSGDVSKLSAVYDNNIEIKTFSGNSSLRRKLTKCNDLPIATISSGLPTKGENKMINWTGVQNEKALRTMIKKNLNKEYHASTKCSVDYIYKILNDSYEQGLKYDVSDMENAVFAFAAGSTNQADYCIKLVNKMKFKSDEPSVPATNDESSLVFYDVEVFPNLFLVNWKVAGEGKPVVRMINPKPSDIEDILKFRLVGFNCRRYDNHMLYACLMGYSNEQLYNLSSRIINSKKGENRDAFFGEAYNISYTDVYDFAAKKQSLKKWEIELGIHHQELGLPWDKPVPEEMWEKVAEYCDNDVIATEVVFYHLKGDFRARQILADFAGGTVNDTTNSLTTKSIFGKEKHPKMIYTHLDTGMAEDDAGLYEHDPETNGKYIQAFPGYEFVYSQEDKKFHNMYRGTDLGFGGYVYAEPGMYGNVALLDIESLHPNSIIAMNCFGEYTQHFKDILDARMYIKHGDFDSARKMLGGKLAPYLDDESTAKDLAQALKIAINSVYGLTSANFDNPFRDIRNRNNIVALRGALFMRTLQDEVQNRGFTVCHIKTDSIKIPDATPEIIEFCMEFAKKYGYTFEHEATYERMCLVNDSVYIAKYKDGKHAGEWTATGKQFAVPYVFKTLFSKEPIIFNDMCETFAVTKGDIYLDMNETLPDVSEWETLRHLIEKSKTPTVIELTRKEHELLARYESLSDEDLQEYISKGHDYRFVGRVGQFCPVKPGRGGGTMYRVQNGKYCATSGSKGYRWIESELISKRAEEMVSVTDSETGDKKDIAKLDIIAGNEGIIDISYYRKLVDDAIEAISDYGDFEWFVSDDPYIPEHPVDDECPFDIA